MPTIFIYSGFRFFFYSNESAEPAHVHVIKAGNEAKVWLHDLSVAANFGFAAHELRLIVQIVRERQFEIRKAWRGHFHS